MVIVMSGYQAPNLLAIRLGLHGDLTGTDAILWQNQPGNSYTPSPVLQHLALHSIERTPLVTRKLMAGALTCILKPIARP